MGRELKRVPLDFSWPINEVWTGFLNPHYTACHNCPHCDGSGYSPKAKRFSDEWYGYANFEPEEYGVPQLRIDDQFFRETIIRKIRHSDTLVEQGHQSDNYYMLGCATFEEAVDREARRMWNHCKNQWVHHLSQDDVDALAEAGRLHDFTHHWIPGSGWIPNEPPTPPTASEVNAWSLHGMSHDSINSWVCIRERCNREGVAVSCSQCDGSGSYWDSPEAQAAAESWEETEPPPGDGYQLWETVSEGSPVSPVCETPEKLAAWLVENDGSVTSDTTYDQWLRFINGPGWAPSSVMTNGKMKSGTKAVGSTSG